MHDVPALRPDVALRVRIPDEAITFTDMFAGDQTHRVQEQVGDFLVATKANLEEFARLLSCLVEGNQGWASAAPVLALGCTSLFFTRNGRLLTGPAGYEFDATPPMVAAP